MISSKIQALNKAIQSLDQSKMQTTVQLDSLALISENTARQKKKSTFGPKTSPSKGSRPIIMTQFPEMSSEVKKLIQQLYTSRCLDLSLQHNESSWEAFVQSYTQKNRKAEKLDLSNLNLGERANKRVNEIIIKYREIDLSRNHLSCLMLENFRICSQLTSLTLSNCNLKNENLQFLFDMLTDTPVKCLILSSPDLKDRNQLTKYQALYLFIKNSSIQSLGLSNIQINPDNNIFLHSKDTNLKTLDLSKNTDVCGMNKTLSEVNLSWNAISEPTLLRCPNTQLKKLNITGNPLPYYEFDEFLIIDFYRNLTHLVLNYIPFTGETPALQTFIQKSIFLRSLQMVNCQISKETFINIAYGLEVNHVMTSLNLSKNKFPLKGVDETLGHSLSKSKIKELSMSLCQIKDECGEILLSKLCSSKQIERIDMSKNSLGMKTALTLCNSLKRKCFGLLELNIEQNFIKYDYLKEIKDYIDRNIFMDKSKVREQYKKIKQVLFDQNQASKQIKKMKESKVQIQAQIATLRVKLLERKKEFNAVKKQLIQQELKIIKEEEIVLSRKVHSVEKEVQELQIQSKKRIDSESIE